jgi:murein DD-endopeptidase MepM/ murein hydrolase activator NlpD
VLSRARRLAACALPLLLAACGNGTPRATPTTPAVTTPPATTALPTTAPPKTPSAAPTAMRRPTVEPTAATTTPPPAPRGTDHAFPIQGCAASYGHAHHDYPATDIFAARGCAFVAPVAGRVDEVSYADHWDSRTNKGADRGGLSVSVVGVDGVRYYGSHLSAIAPGIKPGVTVKAGTRLGSVGNTGSARGIATHLHFGISWPTRNGVWWVRRGEVYPWPYLDSWRARGDRSPAAEVEAKRRRVGTVPPCPSYC